MRVRLLTALALLGTGCQPPDRPAALPEEIPSRVQEMLRPDSVRSLVLAPGVIYRFLWSELGPWAVHLLEADLSSCRVGLAVTRAPGEPGADDALSPVSRLLGLAPEGAVAGVNGDFFTREGSPRGPEVSTRGLRASGRRPAFSWTPAEGPWIGLAEVVEGTLVVEPSSGEPEFLVAGYPELLDGGRPVGDLEVGTRPSFAAVRHPRTAVGFSREDERLWVAVVEGRQRARSAGMTLPEMTNLLLALGATEALNLDGGGSSVMVLEGRAASRPSDAEGERAVVNALVVRSTPLLCRSPHRPQSDLPPTRQ